MAVVAPAQILPAGQESVRMRQADPLRRSRAANRSSQRYPVLAPAHPPFAARWIANYVAFLKLRRARLLRIARKFCPHLSQPCLGSISVLRQRGHFRKALLESVKRRVSRLGQILRPELCKGVLPSRARNNIVENAVIGLARYNQARIGPLADPEFRHADLPSKSPDISRYHVGCGLVEYRRVGRIV